MNSVSNPAAADGIAQSVGVDFNAPPDTICLGHCRRRSSQPVTLLILTNDTQTPTTHEYSITKPPWSTTLDQETRWWADSTQGLAQSTLGLLRRIFLLVKISYAAPCERNDPHGWQPAKFSSSVENGYSVDPAYVLQAFRFLEVLLRSITTCRLATCQLVSN